MITIGNLKSEVQKAPKNLSIRECLEITTYKRNRGLWL